MTVEKNHDLRFTYDRSEVGKCLLCHDPLCSKACPQSADVGGILRSLYFDNFLGAAAKLTCECVYCNAPCEKACVLARDNEPVAVREVMLDVKAELPNLPAYKT